VGKSNVRAFEGGVHSISSSPRVLFWKDVICNHAARIRDLDLAETSKFTLLVLFGGLQPSSLPLHSLQLRQSTQQDFPTFPIAVVQTYQLQSLSVTGYEGAWYSLPFSCLTNLKMHNIPSRPHLEEFIETLRGNPHLQTIDMEDSLPSGSEVMGSIARVNLPKLGSLRLSSTRKSQTFCPVSLYHRQHTSKSTVGTEIQHKTIEKLSSN